MTNAEYLREKVKYHIRDVHLEDDGIDSVIQTVLEDISLGSRVFKKLHGFTVHKDVNLYNFRYLGRLNEQVEKEPTSITFTAPEQQEILDFLKYGTLPSPTVNKVLQDDLAQSRVMDVLDIFDDEGRSILDKFEERGSSYYFCYDQEWLNNNDGKQMCFSAWIVPHIDELAEEQLLDIVQCVIAGTKFYVNDTLHSKDDTQATNYDFMRYHQCRENLTNRYPTAVVSRTDFARENRWL